MSRTFVKHVKIIVKKPNVSCVYKDWSFQTLVYKYTDLFLIIHFLSAVSSLKNVIYEFLFWKLRAVGT
jgi:uncharacterized membrane protein YjdF